MIPREKPHIPHIQKASIRFCPEISEHLYEEDADRDSNVLEVIIGRLRRKLDPDRTLNPVETARGQGYRFRFTPTQNDAS